MLTLFHRGKYRTKENRTPVSISEALKDIFCTEHVKLIPRFSSTVPACCHKDTAGTTDDLLVISNLGQVLKKYFNMELTIYLNLELGTGRLKKKLLVRQL